MDRGRVARWERLNASHEYNDMRDGGCIFEREDAVRFIDLLRFCQGETAGEDDGEHAAKAFVCVFVCLCAVT